MKNRKAAWFSILILALIGASVEAHHAISMHFDPSKALELRGVVVDFKLRSPHSSLVIDGIALIDGIAQSSEAVRWEVESHSVPGMRKAGIQQGTFQPGDEVTVIGAPNRDPNFRFVFGATISKADGSFNPINAGLAPPVTRAAPVATGDGVQRIVGRWQSPGYINGEDSPLPLNAAGRQAWENYDPKLSPAAQCVTQNLPGVFSAPYLSDVRMDGDTVTIRNEAYDVRRTIRIGDEFAPANENGQFGDARARIDGDSLVIESRNYPPSGWGLGIATHLNGGGADVPSSAEKTLVERYSVSEDGQNLILDYTLSDPVYLARPHDGRFELIRVPDETPIYDYECDLESAAMFARDADDPPLQIGD